MDKETKRKQKVEQALKDKKIINDTSFTVFQMVEDLRDEVEEKLSQIQKDESPDARAERLAVKLSNKMASQYLALEKGDDGHTPTDEELQALIEPLIPVPIKGDDYVLTPQDKQEIAGLVKVPIVEKEIETIIEKTEVRIEPVVTENVVEKAMYEEPNQIVAKINTASDLIDNNRIKGFSDLEKISKMNAFNPTMGPSFSDLAKINRRIDTFTSSSSLIITEVDGSPTGTPTTLKFTNGSVTDNGDGSFTVATGAGGGGDVSSNTSTSVDSELALFSGTAGKTIKRATGSGVAILVSGVLSTLTTTGTAGNAVLSISPTLTTPILGTPTSVTLTNATGLPLTTGVTGTLGAANGGTGVSNNAASTLTISGSFGTTFTISNTTALTLPTSGTLYGTQNSSITSAQLASSLSDETGTGFVVFSTSPSLTTPTITSATLITPALGTPASGVMTNVTGTATGLTSGITLALKSATTTVDVSAATAPTSGQVLTSTGGTSATWQTPGAGMAIGGSITSATQGSLLYAGASGVLAQDNSNLFYYATNKQLRIGPTGTSSENDARVHLLVTNNVNDYGDIAAQNLSSGDSATTDMFTSADNDSTTLIGHYTNFGITGSGWSPVAAGNIKTVSVSAAGTGYSVGNVLTITSGGDSNATVTVATTGGGGSITSVTLSNNGTGYVTGSGYTTSGGAGSGATINVLSLIDFTLWGANDGYLFNSGGNLIISTDTTGTAIKFSVGGIGTVNQVGQLSVSGFTIGLAGTLRGKISFAGNTSGTTTVQANSSASGTLTLPATTDTLVAQNTSDTFTNKTITSSTNVLGKVTMGLGSDADGDVYYLSSGLLTRLAKGTAGQILAMNGGATAPVWSSAGAGTVTNTGGTLTANSVVLGAGSADTKVVAGITTNGAGQLILGVNTTTLGSVKMFGNTSGDLTLQPTAAAGTATIITFPASTSTVLTTTSTVSALTTVGTITTGTWKGGSIIASNSGNFDTSSGATNQILSANNIYEFLTSGIIGTASVNTNAFSVVVGQNTITEAASGTHVAIGSVAIRAPIITDGAGATTNAVTLYVEGAPTGTATPTNVYAAWFDAGEVRIDGDIGDTTNRVNKGWFTGMETTTIELGAASDTTLSRVSAGVIAVEGVTIATSSNTLTFTNKSIVASQITTGTFGTGAYTMDTSLTVPQTFHTENAVTASSNAVTFTRANRNNKVANNSAAGLTITLSTSGAVAGDMIKVKSVPSSNVAQTITWVNTENSDITPSANLNASTTSPRTDGFEWNALTSKWRCIGSC